MQNESTICTCCEVRRGETKGETNVAFTRPAEAHEGDIEDYTVYTNTLGHVGPRPLPPVRRQELDEVEGVGIEKAMPPPAIEALDLR